jgi:cytochrome oxidase Cu insertion factor (SCO1/SenC/PrrC family)
MRASVVALLAVTILAGVSPVAVAGSERVEDLMRDLQILPLDARTPPPLALIALDGKRVSLADFRGRPLLVYFWASW